MAHARDEATQGSSRFAVLAAVAMGSFVRSRVTSRRSEGIATNPIASRETPAQDAWTSFRHPHAIRAYRQVATLLRQQGMTEPARAFDYRATQLTRRLLPDANSWPRWLRWLPRTGWAAKRFLSFILDQTSRYGYSPARVLATYLATVLSFAVIYRVVGITGWDDSIPFSLIAFHGRGVINGSIGPKDPQLWIPAIEAAVGLLSEALLVATIIRRLFRQ